MAARVLVVDDEPEILTSFADLLEVSLPGVVVATARSGAEGLAALRGGSFDLIVSDLRMPGMDGLAFLAEASRLAPGTPAIMVTAFPELEVVLRAVNERRIRAFLMKPADPATLLAAVEEILVEGPMPDAAAPRVASQARGARRHMSRHMSGHMS